MAIGMSSEEFWHGEPDAVKAYREAHEIRNEIRNQELWMQGLYNYRAFSSVIEGLAFGLSQGKGNKPSKYPEQPFAISENAHKAEVERNKKRTLDWVKAHQ